MRRFPGWVGIGPAWGIISGKLQTPSTVSISLEAFSCLKRLLDLLLGKTNRAPGWPLQLLWLLGRCAVDFHPLLRHAKSDLQVTISRLSFAFGEDEISRGLTVSTSSTPWDWLRATARLLQLSQHQVLPSRATGFGPSSFEVCAPE